MVDKLKEVRKLILLATWPEVFETLLTFVFAGIAGFLSVVVRYH
jgi:hypothetical protein